MEMFGLTLFDQDKETLYRRLVAGIADGEKLSLAFCELNMLGEYLENREFAGKLDHFNLVMADGSALLLLKRLFLPAARLERIPGPDFFKYILEQDTSHRHFFLGSSQATLDTLKNKLLSVNPALQIGGLYSPPFEKNFSEATKREILEQVNLAEVDFLWVSFGCPKQESWIYDNFNSVKVSVMAGVGAAFDFHSGRVRRAPALFRRLGLEFAFRIFTQPRIVWRVVKGVSRIVKNMARIKDGAR